MRILSQDGMVFNDIPYEKFCLGITKDRITNKFCIVARKNIISESGFKLNDVMAEYSTEAKAKKAIEIIHDACAGYEMYKNMSKQQKTSALSYIDDESNHLKHLFGIFKFPQDNEIDA